MENVLEKLDKHALYEKIERHAFGPIFAAYEYEGDYILYGEVDIYRVDKDLNEKWRFFGEDIFITGSGEEGFLMKEDRICLWDFMGKYYELDYNGNELV